jgi:hypothetical protein
LEKFPGAIRECFAKFEEEKRQDQELYASEFRSPAEGKELGRPVREIVPLWNCSNISWTSLEHDDVVCLFGYVGKKSHSSGSTTDLKVTMSVSVTIYHTSLYLR